MSGIHTERSNLGAMIAIAIEIMAFAGICAAVAVLEGGAQLRTGRQSMIATWTPVCVLAIAFSTSAMAKRGVRYGVTLPAHWGANLTLVAGVFWCVLSWERMFGVAGDSRTEPVASLVAIAVLGLGLHVVIAVLQVARSIAAMLRGRHTRASRFLERSQLLWLAALIIQLLVTLAGEV